MDNMKIYESVRSVPKEAQKAITGGRLKGFTDINPMWRIKKLTEEFGPVGIGWYYDIVEKQIIDGGIKKDVTEKIATVDINLYIKVDGEWSKPISGTGGASFIAGEKYGAYTSDECFKMALTDAISVVCKALGFAADVYWDKDRSKYTHTPEPDKHTKKPTTKKQNTSVDMITDGQVKFIHSLLNKYSDSEKAKQSLYKKYNVESVKDLTKSQASEAIKKMNGGK